MIIYLGFSDKPCSEFKKLAAELDRELAIIDGEEHRFYNQFNGIDQLDQYLLLGVDDKNIGCGALKYIDDQTYEIKRMYVTASYRNDGFGTTILEELEKFAKEKGAKYLVLEAGKRQPEALLFYKRNGFKVTANYGQYKGVENSVCFKKTI